MYVSLAVGMFYPQTFNAVLDCIKKQYKKNNIMIPSPAVGQEVTVMPEYATLFIAVEPLTTILTSFERLSAVVAVM